MKYNSSDIEYLKKYIKEKKLDNNYYEKCLKELEKGKPIQYIIGNVNFYGYEFIVNEHVLIPRFETELLISKTINRIEKLFPHKKIDIIDLGCGSGCIGITMKKELDCQVTALDISAKALEVAKENAQKNEALINFIQADMTSYTSKRFDVIISNPPYIKEDEEIMDIVKNNEPNIALYAKENGLYFYKRIIENIPLITKNDFLIAFEIGNTLSTAIVDIAQKLLKDINISVEKDYSGYDRYIFITNIKK